MHAYERFIRYVKVHTTSAFGKDATPSTAGQWDLARLLVEELRELGLEEPSVDDSCVVTAWLPATAGCESVPALGFIAHMDTSPAFSGEGVAPILHENYDGGDIVLPRGGRVIRTADFPFLKELKGQTLITADGSTLLGADDKAGVAEIMTLCEQLIAEKLPHGRICVAFTPDEEIGEGADHFDVARFGAKYAYTIDGGQAGSIEYENFNAAAARVEIAGVSIHPGAAKDIMENALLIAMELNAMLPADEVPGKTCGYQGFFHLGSMEGDAAFAWMDYIIRDHDRERFEQRKALMEQAAASVAAAHPTARVELKLRDTYYNMKEQLRGCMHLIENAEKAAELAGIVPVVEPIRGGTDGARLSYMGLPCPNLGTGGYNCHGPCELASAEQMDQVVAMLKNIVGLYAKM